MKIINYRETDGEKGPLVFIHGNSSALASFEPQVDHFASLGYRTLSFDLPGHGKSFRASNDLEGKSYYSFMKLQETILTFFEERKISHPTIIGHSLGGHLALGVSNRIAVKGLMVVGTPPLESIEDFSHAFIQSEYVAPFFSENPKEEEVKGMVNSFAENEDARRMIRSWYDLTDPRFRQFFTASLNDGLLPKEVSLIQQRQCPIELVVLGKDSTISPSYIQNLNLPVPLNYIQDGLHFYHYERPEEFNLLLGRFLKSLES